MQQQMNQAIGLLPHCLYNCAIELLPVTIPPHNKVYSFSFTEQSLDFNECTFNPPHHTAISPAISPSGSGRAQICLYLHQIGSSSSYNLSSKTKTASQASLMHKIFGHGRKLGKTSSNSCLLFGIIQVMLSIVKTLQSLLSSSRSLDN